MKQDIEIYSKVYDVMNENMEAAGEEFSYTKDAFLYSTKRDLKTVDMLDIIELDKKSFEQALNIGILFRLPKENEVNVNENDDESDLEYKKRKFEFIAGSSGAYNMQVVITNNIFEEPITKIGRNPVRVASGYFRCIDKLHKFYYKLPAPVKAAAKKILGR